MRNLLIAGAAVVAIAIAAILILLPKTPSPPPRPVSVRAIRTAFEYGNYPLAFEQAEAFLKEDEDPAVLMIAAESATKMEQFDTALQYYARVPETAKQAAVASWAMGEIELHLAHTSKSFDAIERSLELDPNLALAHERYIELCNMVGRRHDSLPSLLFMLRTNRLKPDYLLFMGNLAKETCAAPALKTYLQRTPSDLMPNLGLARLALADGRLDEARELLEKLLEQQPTLVEAHAQLGFVLLDLDPSQIPRWSESLPPKAIEHPDIWFVRGRWLQGTQPDSAIRCFAEAIRRDANHLIAHQAIAQTLLSVGDEPNAKRFAAKAATIQKIHLELLRIYEARTLTESMQVVAKATLELGRLWEATGWCIVANTVDPKLTWPTEIGTQLAANPLTPESPHTLASANLATKGDWLERFPLPDWSSVAASETTRDRSTDIPPEQFYFRDVAAELGVSFTFNNNASATHEGHRIFEMTGGGIGVADYDNDGRPDLYLAQGGDFPAEIGNESHQDQLFQNAIHDGAGKFKNRTEEARLQDYSFGQGVAAGDVNSDGFDDIYVCNVGSNELWLNCGDGTFQNASGLIATRDRWTCSAVIVDLNNDGLAEIYDADYVMGSDVATRMCDVGKLPRVCSPLVFEPTDDQVLFANDHGTFDAMPLPADSAANGLGVAALKLDGYEFPSLFVSVDQEANLFWNVSATDDVDAADTTDETGQGSRDPGFTLENDAVLSGLAYDSGGRSQACMGIAAGDADGNGEVDLFVTNFHLEYYTLYLQQNGLFNDRTAASGTIPDTRPLLGFGTQFFDAQLDGVQDLMVLNGHIDDHTHMGIPEEMPPQFFVGIGNAKFSRAMASESDDFRERLGLGRCLARIDFDGDGMLDFACGELEKAPLNLVKNECAAEGLPITLQLVGTASDRNAFCTNVKISGHGYEQRLQLTGGGYQSTNERNLVFSVPLAALEKSGVTAESARFSLEIEWPSGLVEQHTNVSAGSRSTAIEGGERHIH